MWELGALLASLIVIWAVNRSGDEMIDNMTEEEVDEFDRTHRHWK